MDRLKDFAAGTVAGFAGKLIDYPLDTVKVLLQTQNVKATAETSQQPTVYRGAWHCFRHTLQTSGVTGLYKGLSSPLIGSMAENAVIFFAYSSFKRSLGEIPGQHNLSLFELGLAGAGAGAVVSFVLTPVELVKCRLQVQNSTSSGFRAYKGPIDVIRQTIKTEGLISGLYRGHSSTLLREIPGNFCWYGVYECVCKAMIPDGGTKADLGPSAYIIGGASAGIAYWTAFYPADTVKSRIQTSPEHAKHGFVETFGAIWRAEGIRGLYRGWGVTVARAAPAHAAMFAAYEYTIKLLRPPPAAPMDEDDFDMLESIRD